MQGGYVAASILIVEDGCYSRVAKCISHFESLQWRQRKCFYRALANPSLDSKNSKMSTVYRLQKWSAFLEPVQTPGASESTWSVKLKIMTPNQWRESILCGQISFDYFGFLRDHRDIRKNRIHNVSAWKRKVWGGIEHSAQLVSKTLTDFLAIAIKMSDPEETKEKEAWIQACGPATNSQV